MSFLYDADWMMRRAHAGNHSPRARISSATRPFLAASDAPGEKKRRSPFM
jgi:hypothetical protein